MKIKITDPSLCTTDVDINLAIELYNKYKSEIFENIYSKMEWASHFSNPLVKVTIYDIWGLLREHGYSEEHNILRYVSNELSDLYLSDLSKEFKVVKFGREDVLLFNLNKTNLFLRKVWYLSEIIIEGFRTRNGCGG